MDGTINGNRRLTAPFRDRLVSVLAMALVFGALLGCGGEESSDATPLISADTLLSLRTFSQSSGTAALLQAVSPVSPEVAWVSGHDGTYALTVDGGSTWRTSVMEGQEDLQFRDVAAFDSLTAYLMSSGTGPQSRIYRTDDGGESWQLQFTAENPRAFLDCMDFWDRDRGLAYGDAVDGTPFILRTLDGGRRWTRIRAPDLPPALEGEGGFAASGTCLQVGAFGTAWIATGAGPRSRILMTEDWGNSWTEAEVPVVAGEMAGLTTIRVIPDGWGMALGGIIGADTLRTRNTAVTVDGGLSWKEAPPPNILGPVYGSALVELESGYGVVAVGPGGMDWSRAPAFHWQRADSVTYWAVDFAGPEAGWAVGPGGRITRLAFRKGG